MKKNGYLITIEGIDGSGKSTLCQGLWAALASAHHEVLVTREPGGSDLGKHLRALLHEQTIQLNAKAEYLLFAADRAQHIASVVKPALDQGKIVISDRMGDSSLAYQGYGRGLDCQMIKEVNSWAMNGIEPDLILYLKLPISYAIERIKKTRPQLTSFEKEADAFWYRVADGFEEIFKEKKQVLTLDALAQPQDLVDKVMAHFKL